MYTLSCPAVGTFGKHWLTARVSSRPGGKAVLWRPRLAGTWQYIMMVYIWEATPYKCSWCIFTQMCLKHDMRTYLRGNHCGSDIESGAGGIWNPFFINTDKFSKTFNHLIRIKILKKKMQLDVEESTPASDMTYWFPFRIAIGNCHHAIRPCV